MFSDIRYALRALRHSPGFTVAVVVTLALGIGANTAIFSVVRGVLLKPLPHRDGDRLVYLRHSADGPGQANLTFSVPEVRDFRSSVPSLASIAEYSTWSTIHQMVDGAERLKVGLVTGNYFDVMGLAPILGRVTGPGDDGPGVPPVAVLSYEYWLNRFGGDSAIVGKTITLGKKSVTVIGVLQPAPFFPEPVQAYLNMVNSEHHLSATMLQFRTHRMTEVVARLAPGATLEQVRAQVSAVYARFQRDFPDAYDPSSHYRVAVVPFKAALGERARLTLWLLMGAAAFVLLIAVANVTNLTLMRGVRREHELVVRAALGAGVGRLRQLLLTENLILALMGAALGLMVAVGALRLLVSLAERYSPRASEIHLDAVVLGFTLALSIIVALLLSLLGSLPKHGAFATRIAVGAVHVIGSPKKQRLQRGLVVAQIAASCVLLGGAGLLTRTMIRLSKVDTGLRTEEVLAMRVTIPLTRAELRSGGGAAAAATQQYVDMRNELAALPGVVEVGIGSPLPLRRSEVTVDVRAEGRPLAVGEAMPRAEVRTASPEFFDAAGIPVLRGRPFAMTDGAASNRVMIINETLADRLFPHDDPIGKRIASLEWQGDSVGYRWGEWRTVVGVVGNTQDGGLNTERVPVVFLPIVLGGPLVNGMGAGLVIRADTNVAGLAAAATRIARRVAPTALIEDVMTMAQYKDRSIAPWRLNAALVSSFGLLAVIIAAVGIAGVLGFSVSSRTNEIGIRMSLGADSSRVQRMVLSEGFVLVAFGLVLGLVTAGIAARIIRGLLFGVEPYDPATLLGVTVMMAVIALVACWIPALRASRIDPAITMRSQQ
ncbi:MAG TPA: ABC transporter permease [Gemmatimonadales bacterium]|nr:ABC transporter permease [Gemmatimonadales bacterium]